jgi:hypothetical protein
MTQEVRNQPWEVQMTKELVKIKSIQDKIDRAQFHALHAQMLIESAITEAGKEHGKLYAALQNARLTLDAATQKTKGVTGYILQAFEFISRAREIEEANDVTDWMNGVQS